MASDESYATIQAAQMQAAATLAAAVAMKGSSSVSESYVVAVYKRILSELRSGY